MAWLPDGEINLEDIFIRFGATHERDRRTDGHRMPAIAALMHSIARQKRTIFTKVMLKCKRVQFFDSQCTTCRPCLYALRLHDVFKY